MLFKIKAMQTIQLHPADFHNQYKEALKIMLRRELLHKLNEKYGRVIALRIDDSNFVFDNPRLLTHQGLALFKVQFEALVERTVSEEVVYGLLLEINPGRAPEKYQLIVRVGTQDIPCYVDEYLYDISEAADRIFVRPEFLQQQQQYKSEYINEFVVGKMYRVAPYSLTLGKLLDVFKPEEEEELGTEAQVEQQQPEDEELLERDDDL